MPQDLQDRAVDAEIAELVDDEREPPPARVFERVPDERGFAGAEKASDDGDGNFWGDHAVRSCGSGGMRASTPRFTISGRSRQAGTPSGCAA